MLSVFSTLATARAFIIFPLDCDYENVCHFQNFVPSIHIQRFENSDYLLPPKIRQIVQERPEYRMGTFLPLLVSVGGHMKYLVPAFSLFFRCGQLKGKEVHPDSWAEPQEDQQKKGNYQWADNLEQELGITFANLDFTT